MRTHFESRRFPMYVPVNHNHIAQIICPLHHKEVGMRRHDSRLPSADGRKDVVKNKVFGNFRRIRDSLRSVLVEQHWTSCNVSRIPGVRVIFNWDEQFRELVWAVGLGTACPQTALTSFRRYEYKVLHWEIVVIVNKQAYSYSVEEFA